MSLYEIYLNNESTGLKAFIVIDSLVWGISGGGLRTSPKVSMGEVRELARTMTYKWAAMGIPFGGAKAGIVAQPDAKNKLELLQSFARLAKPLMHHNFFTGPDMGTTSEEVEFIFREAGIDTISFVRKKLRERGIEISLPKNVSLTNLGGRGFEDFITGYGVFSCIEEACKFLRLKMNEQKAVLQGFGTVGYSTAHYLSKQGVKIVGISDLAGTIYNEKGLDIEAIYKARDRFGTIDRKKLSFQYEELGREEILELDTDILIPAAVASAINSDNASKVKAKLVVEAANIPVTKEAEKSLHKRKILVIPDFIANAGLACGFGLIMTGKTSTNRDEVFNAVAKRIKHATYYIIKKSKEEKITPREAALKFSLLNAKEFASQS
ncbi:MAG: Glu/Leu/Phe/Val dehydrogenase dimerization domain-containing protein [Candidatus Thermoplasmatota archaeon]